MDSDGFSTSCEVTIYHSSPLSAIERAFKVSIGNESPPFREGGHTMWPVLAFTRDVSPVERLWADVSLFVPCTRRINHVALDLHDAMMAK